jgi:hypothetical protein
VRAVAAIVAAVAAESLLPRIKRAARRGGRCGEEGRRGAEELVARRSCIPRLENLAFARLELKDPRYTCSPCESNALGAAESLCGPVVLKPRLFSREENARLLLDDSAHRGPWLDMLGNYAFCRDLFRGNGWEKKSRKGPRGAEAYHNIVYGRPRIGRSPLIYVALALSRLPR